MSCSTQDEEDTRLKISAETIFIKYFYKTTWKYGKSEDLSYALGNTITSKAPEFEELRVSEIFVGNDVIPRGYTITNKNTNEFLYFINVDRTLFKLVAVDIKANDHQIFNNIDELEKYVITNEFYIITIALEPDTDPDSIETGKFWGWKKWVECDKSTGQGYVFQTYYIVGIGVRTVAVIGQNNQQLIEPCGGGALGDDK